MPVALGGAVADVAEALAHDLEVDMPPRAGQMLPTSATTVARMSACTGVRPHSSTRHLRKPQKPLQVLPNRSSPSSSAF